MDAEGMQEECPRNITALIFHPGSRARRFAPVFNITPRSRMFYPPPPNHHVSLPTLVLPRFAAPSLPFLPPRSVLFVRKPRVSRLVTNLRY